MKIFTSALLTETNTFSDFDTTLASFEEMGIVRGVIAADGLNEVGKIVEHWRRLARQGGDEFLMVLRDLSEASDPVRICQRLLHDVREPFLLESSVPGVFVAGDVRHGSVKRVASAVGEGSIAVQFAHQYLAGF